MCKTQNGDLGPATHDMNIPIVYNRVKILTHIRNLDFSWLYPFYILVSTTYGLAIKGEKKVPNSKHILIGVNSNDMV